MSLSLDMLCQRHESILVIDSASSCIHVGALQRGKTAEWVFSDLPAGEGLFVALEELGAKIGRKPADLDAFAFNEGPGSILGIRTVAVALRVWASVRERPVYAYQGLQIFAEAERKRGRTQPFAALADARRETWHRVIVAENRAGPVERVAQPEIAGACIAPSRFRAWAALPAGTETVAYEPAALLAETRELPLFRQSTEPDAFLHEDPSYKTWEPGIHRAPTS